MSSQIWGDAVTRFFGRYRGCRLCDGLFDRGTRVFVTCADGRAGGSAGGASAFVGRGRESTERSIDG